MTIGNRRSQTWVWASGLGDRLHGRLGLAPATSTAMPAGTTPIETHPLATARRGRSTSPDSGSCAAPATRQAGPRLSAFQSDSYRNAGGTSRTRRARRAGGTGRSQDRTEHPPTSSARPHHPTSRRRGQGDTGIPQPAGRFSVTRHVARPPPEGRSTSEGASSRRPGHDRPGTRPAPGLRSRGTPRSPHRARETP